MPEANDEIAIVDASAATTKKITREDFLKGAALPADTVDTQAIADGAVTPDKRAGGFWAGVYDFGSGTGSYSITDVPFKPKALVVVAIGGAGSSSSGVGLIGGYAADGSAQGGTSSTLSTSGGGVIGSNTSIDSPFHNTDPTSGAYRFRAVITSWDANGITVNKTTASSVATQRTFHILFMG